jgi:hypothetical protein
MSHLNIALEEYIIALYIYDMAAEDHEAHKEYLQKDAPAPQPPKLTPKINEMLLNTGFSAEQLLSVLEFYEPDIDGHGNICEERGPRPCYYFDLDRLASL